MSNMESSGSETGSDSGSEEVKDVEKTQIVSGYEKQRLKRMAENKARMEAMGLHKMASSLMGCGRMKENQKREAKGKKKVFEEDEDYKPEVGFETEGDDEDDDSVSGNSSGTKFKKATKKNSASSRKVANKNVSSNSNFVVDDDDALMQAIALSLQESAGFLDVVDHGPSKSSYTRVKDCDVDKRKGSSPIKEDTGKRRKIKSTSSRVQMTEDELILHFFQFDEVGQGSITLRDLRRVAAAHDFTWSDKEMEDMIHIFDCDGDGKLSLEDFRTIVGQCRMIQPVTGSKSD